MIEPRRDEFNGGVPIALYRLVAPATLKLSKAAEPSQHAAGEVVAMRGYPAAPCAPINGEAVYAKLSAIRRQVREEGWLSDAPLIAASLGAPVLSQIDASAFVSAWLQNPQSVKQP